MTTTALARLRFPLFMSAIALALVVATGGLASAQPLEFDAPAIVASGNFSSLVRLGDVDRDGHLDVLVGNRGDTTIGIHRGLGDGRFAPVPPIRVGSTPKSIEIDDLDFDGDVDLIAGCAWEVQVWHGEEGFAFALAQTIDEWLDIASGDFNEDGRFDLAAVRIPSGYLDFHPGDGFGRFHPPIRSSLRLFEGGNLVAADLNGDSHLDLAQAVGAGAPTGTRHVLFGDGSGAFTLEASLTDVPASGLATGDTNDDGLAELIVIYGTSVKIVPGPATTDDFSTSYETIGRSTAVATADTNGDEHLDVVTGSAAGIVALFRGQGSGAFASPPEGIGGGTACAALAFGDVDEDGELDVLVANGEANTVTLARGDGSGRFVGARISTAPMAVREMATGDLDGDGIADIVVLSGQYRATHVDMLLADGRGSFPARQSFPIGSDLLGIAIADFDEDGSLDVATTNRAFGLGLVVLLGNGEGGILRRLPSFPVQGAHSLVAADFDFDGLTDIAVGSFRGEGHHMSVFLADGRGSFVPLLPFPVPFGTVSSDAGDVTGDGIVDIACASSGSIGILEGTRDGRFQPGPAVPAGSLEWLRIADFVNDGALDVIAANGSDSTVEVYIAEGNARMIGPRSTPGHHSPLAGSVADFDEDGCRDVSVISHGASRMTVLRGDGLGGFVSRASDAEYPGLERGFVAGILRFPNSMVAADFDDDGHVDLAASGYSSGAIFTLLNRSFDSIACRAGNVNAAAGPVADVLFVNGSVGTAVRRVVELARGVPVIASMEAPPGNEHGRAEFALYAWSRLPSDSTVRTLPGGIGRICLSTPLTPGGRQPKVIWNNIRPLSASAAGPRSFGDPTAPSRAAPSVVFERSEGFASSFAFFLQGIVEDRSSPASALAVTNGIAVVVR